MAFKNDPVAFDIKDKRDGKLKSFIGKVVCVDNEDIKRKNLLVQFENNNRNAYIWLADKEVRVLV